MKKNLIVCLFLCVFGFTSSLSITENLQKLGDLSYPYSSWSSKSTKVGGVCQKYWAGQPKERKTIEYSQCYRSEMNKLSMSKNQACKLNDGSYSEVLQFNRTFNEDLILQTDNFGFIKLGKKLYYITTDHVGETDTMRTYFVFSYDCITKKPTQHYEGQGLWNEEKPLWIDQLSSTIYLLKGGPIRGWYDPYKILQVNMKTNSITEYQLFDDALIQDDGTNKLIKGSFIWSEKLAAKLVGWVESYGIDVLKKFYELHSVSIDDLTNFRTYGKIGLSKVVKGKGVMTITMPGYTITADIDFNKKTIK